jgi:hypothetical protein
MVHECCQMGVRVLCTSSDAPSTADHPQTSQCTYRGCARRSLGNAVTFKASLLVDNGSAVVLAQKLDLKIQQMVACTTNRIGVPRVH